MKTQAVIGLAFGDEGKGKVVSALASQSKNQLVIRYCGGPQAGHHVMLKNGVKHIFSHFGSGTLHGCPTYWSKHCTVDPVGLLNELDVLTSKSISPILYLDEQCPITTPFEKERNREIDRVKRHGSCGVGFGQTIQREENLYSLRVSDLLYPSVFQMKLELIRQYYHQYYHPQSPVWSANISHSGSSSLSQSDSASTSPSHESVPEPKFKYNVNNQLEIDDSDWSYNISPSPSAEAEIDLQEFTDTCYEMLNSSHVKIASGGLLDTKYENCIYEGSQGLLLDQEIGFFPHVTRAYTGTTNITSTTPEIFLVTRAYQTRHGNGPMTNEDVSHKILQNPYENNPDTSFQGKFRIATLDLDLLQYAISRDPGLMNSPPYGYNLVVTCLDLVKENYKATIGGVILEFSDEADFISAIKKKLKVINVYLSRTPYPELERFEP